MFVFLLFILRYFQKKNSESSYRSWGNLLWYFWTRILILWDMKFSHKFSCTYFQKLWSMDILVINKTNKRPQQNHYLDKVFSFWWGEKPQPSDFNSNLKKHDQLRNVICYTTFFIFFFLIKVLEKEKMFVHSNLKCHYINLVIVWTSLIYLLHATKTSHRLKALLSTKTCIDTGRRKVRLSEGV